MITAALLILAQAFDTASVRPSASTSPLFNMKDDPGRIAYTNVPLRRVLLTAYDLKNHQLIGPAWLNTLRYDVIATLPPGTSKEQLKPMLQNLLVSRFRMSIRHESRELPVYTLVIGKNGPKIYPIETNAPAEEQIATVKQQEGKDGLPVLNLGPSGLVIETKNGRARISAKAIPLTRLADMLSTRLGKPVLDKTGLSGLYDLTLYFSPEGTPLDTAVDPDIFIAIQEQLGLRLEPTKAAIDMLIIDRADKTPTEN